MERLGLAEVIIQGLEPFGLLRLGVLDQMAQAQEDFRLEQHLEQFVEPDGGLFLDPTQRQQWRDGSADVANFRVMQLAMTKP
ncbi:hypothetical protein D9M68_951170 [compost metagenome]